MWIADKWKDYAVLDTSDGEKLERWGKYTLVRPDPQVIWKTDRLHPGWKDYNGRYIRSSKGGGRWVTNHLPEEWTIEYDTLRFRLKPFSFKHTGLFPEQAVNWDWMQERIRERIGEGPENAEGAEGLVGNAGASGKDLALGKRDAGCENRPVRVLNLFAYTGGATLACAAAGAQVTHVDASKGMVQWAKENARISELPKDACRWLVDDCIKFVEREIRRGNHYDGIIMDPPSYGRGPKGEIWKLEDEIYSFLTLTEQLLSDKPLFFLLNSYTTGLQSSVLSYLLNVTIRAKRGGRTEAGEIGLPVQGKEVGSFGRDISLILPCGASGRWVPEA